MNSLLPGRTVTKKKGLVQFCTTKPSACSFLCIILMCTIRFDFPRNLLGEVGFSWRGRLSPIYPIASTAAHGLPSQVTCSRSSDLITLPADKHKKDDTLIFKFTPSPSTDGEYNTRRSNAFQRLFSSYTPRLSTCPSLSLSLSLYSLSNKNFSLLSLMPSVSSCPCQIVDGHLINNKQGKNSLSKVKKKKEDLERRKLALHRKSIFLHNIKPRSIRLDADVLDEWSCGIRPTVSSTKNATISQQWYTEPWENVSQRGEISKRLTE